MIWLQGTYWLVTVGLVLAVVYSAERRGFWRDGDLLLLLTAWAWPFALVIGGAGLLGRRAYLRRPIPRRHTDRVFPSEGG